MASLAAFFCRLRRHDRGTSMVSYAMVLSLFVVGSIPAIDYVTEESSDEVANQSLCVSQRPPPVECLRRAGDPTFTNTTVATTAPPVPTTAPPTTIATASHAGPEVTLSGFTWTVAFTVSVVDDLGAAVNGAVVEIRAENVGSPFPFTRTDSCVTQSDGSCTVSTTWTQAFTGEVVTEFVSIYAGPTTTVSLPGPVTADLDDYDD